jgi:hypothetical protein
MSITSCSYTPYYVDLVFRVGQFPESESTIVRAIRFLISFNDRKGTTESNRFSSRSITMRKLIIAQARMTSTRLPGKVMKIVCGKPSWSILLTG